MASVTLGKVEKAYDGLKTVHGIDLEIADGEFIVLVGPSGCGKSTTLRMIAGLETVTGGEVAIGGRRVNELQPGERDIAMVFQNYALYPHLSVAENIVFGLKLRKVPKADIESRLKRTAEILGLEQYLDRKPRQLSGGQRQRVAMGRALIRNPAVFLFDEPLSNLDAKLRVQMRTEIKELHARIPTTTIYVTHDQIEAMTLADRVVVMNKGRIEQVAAPEELYQRPATRFVAGFIGSPGMNFFSVTIEAGGSELVLKLPDGHSLAVPDSRRALFAPHVGAQMLIGIRPEHFSAPTESAANTLDIGATLVEPLGMDTLVHFRMNGTDAVARLLPMPGLKAGASLKLAVDMAKVHLLDPKTDAVLG
ncbi:sn-glycerol-3-phosphate ABC transporter ATP-binding protein UgpC [Pelagibacterium sp. 26DY04]|uniref:ABC transporter ATP-binding protein n=1 Tax=Pelagibacterium sp. 26DY04 TaxID=2967130 RepID=UPI00281669CE|nr:sn-glycerol-3-phosphate ABC transporter ATP-binding protein UgpC [Pelagibacterium sp. 26DY04]WMT85287.1 sn-glycerol-3-phosphate ABC transporter ATP-binding protein UgpC [Pelagibacterium sp. 26DY04]